MNKSLFFDAHTHLQMISDLPTEIQKANNVGVRDFICNSTGPNDWKKVISISKEHSNIHIALGVHPAYILNLPEHWLENLETLLWTHSKAHIGEIGLDKLKPEMDLQEEVFAKQLRLAHKLNRPAHIHCVRAWDRLLHIFKTQYGQMPPKILLHSHHGNADLIEEMAKKYNAYFSYSSIFLPENRLKVRACIKATPENRIMIESDAPDLTSSPADIPHLVSQMAKIVGKDTSQMQQILYRNASEFVHGR